MNLITFQYDLSSTLIVSTDGTDLVNKYLCGVCYMLDAIVSL